jgi:hypothetical protein
MSIRVEFRTTVDTAYGPRAENGGDRAHRGVSPERDLGLLTAGIDEWVFLRSTNSR